jgi:phosphate transport system substrate-binding protein
MRNRIFSFAACIAIGALGSLSGCSGPSAGENDKAGAQASGSSEKLSGNITIDGSSTVFPISEAVAEEFQTENQGVKVSVAQSGTGGGFKKFTKGETDISNASRPISTEEMAAAKANNVEFIEIPIAFDGLSIVVNPKNTWVDHLTVAELKKIWEPGSTVKNWSEVRAGWPNVPLKLYGAGTDSGTFDYFTKAIVGKEKASRSDYQSSEDDNTLVTGVAGDEGGLGYFGFAYYLENKTKLKIVPIDGGSGPVTPSHETIGNGTYKPLSRPEFIYVAKRVADRPEVKAFISFHLGEMGQKLVEEVGYIALPKEAYVLGQKRFNDKKTGSLFAGTPQIGEKIEDILAKEK